MKTVKELKNKHRDSAWVDADGDLWLYNTKRREWQYFHNDGNEGFKTPPRALRVDPNSDFGPYTCIHTNTDTRASLADSHDRRTTTYTSVEHRRRNPGGNAVKELTHEHRHDTWVDRDGYYWKYDHETNTWKPFFKVSRLMIGTGGDAPPSSHYGPYRLIHKGQP